MCQGRVKGRPNAPFGFLPGAPSDARCRHSAVAVLHSPLTAVGQHPDVDRIQLLEQEAYVSTVDFRVLGPVEVDADDRSLVLGGPKQKTVLALLIASGSAGQHRRPGHRAVR